MLLLLGVPGCVGTPELTRMFEAIVTERTEGTVVKG